MSADCCAESACAAMAAVRSGARLAAEGAASSAAPATRWCWWRWQASGQGCSRWGLSAAHRESLSAALP